MIKTWQQYINENYLPEKCEILGIEENDLNDILEICVEAFSDVDSPEGIRSFLSSEVDLSISKKCVMGGKIIGCYLFNTSPVSEMLDECGCAIEDYSKYEGLRPLHGLGLALLPEYRGSGIGKKMRNVPLTMDVDYIWGRHLKGLHNIDQWISFGRRVIGENDDEFVTIMDLN